MLNRIFNKGKGAGAAAVKPRGSAPPQTVQVYSAITGGKDAPRDDVHTFTAYDNFRDPRRNAKIYKLLPHLFFDAPWTIWVDGNIVLNSSPEALVELAASKESDMAVFSHPARDCLYDEAAVCMKRGLDNPKIIKEQIDRYEREGFPRNAGLGACYIIIRKNTTKINRLNEKWWAEVCRGSVRDQISFPYVFNGTAHYLPAQKKWNKFFTLSEHLK